MEISEAIETAIEGDFKFFISSCTTHLKWDDIKNNCICTRMPSTDGYQQGWVSGNKELI